MTPNEYQRLCLRTESTANEDPMLRLQHGIIGCCTEAGELADIYKRRTFYNKPLDSTHVAEELGDLLWYISIAAGAMGFNLETIMEMNIAKLRARYPEKYSDAKALNRDLGAELKALENTIRDDNDPSSW